MAQEGSGFKGSVVVPTRQYSDEEFLNQILAIVGEPNMDSKKIKKCLDALEDIRKGIETRPDSRRAVDNIEKLITREEIRDGKKIRVIQTDIEDRIDGDLIAAAKLALGYINNIVLLKENDRNRILGGNPRPTRPNAEEQEV